MGTALIQHVVRGQRHCMLLNSGRARARYAGSPGRARGHYLYCMQQACSRQRRLASRGLVCLLRLPQDSLAHLQRLLRATAIAQTLWEHTAQSARADRSSFTGAAWPVTTRHSADSNMASSAARCCAVACILPKRRWRGKWWRRGRRGGGFAKSASDFD